MSRRESSFSMGPTRRGLRPGRPPAMGRTDVHQCPANGEWRQVLAASPSHLTPTGASWDQNTASNPDPWAMWRFLDIGLMEIRHGSVIMPVQAGNGST